MWRQDDLLKSSGAVRGEEPSLQVCPYLMGKRANGRVELLSRMEGRKEPGNNLIRTRDDALVADTAAPRLSRLLRPNLVGGGRRESRGERARGRHCKVGERRELLG